MSPGENKALFRCFVKAWNSGDLQAMAQYWSPQLVHYSRTGAHGPDQVYTLISGFMRAFPDLTFQIEHIVAESDLVSARMTAQATHQHEFMGVPASGRPVRVTVMGLVRIADGKIVEHWNVMDELHLVQQLGLIPEGYLDAIAIG
jgi:C-1 hydroxylase